MYLVHDVGHNPVIRNSGMGKFVYFSRLALLSRRAGTSNFTIRECLTLPGSYLLRDPKAVYKSWLLPKLLDSIVPIRYCMIVMLSPPLSMWEDRQGHSEKTLSVLAVTVH